MLARIEDGLSTLRDRLATRGFDDLGSEVGAFVRKHPLGTIGIALAAGVAVGVLRGGGRRAAPPSEESARPAMLATVALVAWRLARRAAFDFAATRAQTWVRDHFAHAEGPSGRDGDIVH